MPRLLPERPSRPVLRRLTAKDTLVLTTALQSITMKVNIYAIETNGQTVGYFTNHTEATHNLRYMPKGTYVIREWTQDGEFFTFTEGINIIYQITR